MGASPSIAVPVGQTRQSRERHVPEPSEARSRERTEAFQPDCERAKERPVLSSECHTSPCNPEGGFHLISRHRRTSSTGSRVTTPQQSAVEHDAPGEWLGSAGTPRMNGIVAEHIQIPQTRCPLHAGEGPAAVTPPIIEKHKSTEERPGVERAANRPGDFATRGSPCAVRLPCSLFLPPRRLDSGLTLLSSLCSSRPGEAENDRVGEIDSVEAVKWGMPPGSAGVPDSDSGYGRGDYVHRATVLPAVEEGSPSLAWERGYSSGLPGWRLLPLERVCEEAAGDKDEASNENASQGLSKSRETPESPLRVFPSGLHSPRALSSPHSPTTVSGTNPSFPVTRVRTPALLTKESASRRSRSEPARRGAGSALLFGCRDRAHLKETVVKRSGANSERGTEESECSLATKYAANDARAFSLETRGRGGRLRLVPLARKRQSQRQQEEKQHRADSSQQPAASSWTEQTRIALKGNATARRKSLSAQVASPSSSSPAPSTPPPLSSSTSSPPFVPSPSFGSSPSAGNFCGPAGALDVPFFHPSKVSSPQCQITKTLACKSVSFRGDTPQTVRTSPSCTVDLSSREGDRQERLAPPGPISSSLSLLRRSFATPRKRQGSPMTARGAGLSASRSTGVEKGRSTLVCEEAPPGGIVLPEVSSESPNLAAGLAAPLASRPAAVGKGKKSVPRLASWLDSIPVGDAASENGEVPDTSRSSMLPPQSLSTEERSGKRVPRPALLSSTCGTVPSTGGPGLQRGDSPRTRDTRIARVFRGSEEKADIADAKTDGRPFSLQMPSSHPLAEGMSEKAPVPSGQVRQTAAGCALGGRSARRLPYRLFSFGPSSCAAAFSSFTGAGTGAASSAPESCHVSSFPGFSLLLKRVNEHPLLPAARSSSSFSSRPTEALSLTQGSLVSSRQSGDQAAGGGAREIPDVKQLGETCLEGSVEDGAARADAGALQCTDAKHVRRETVGEVDRETSSRGASAQAGGANLETPCCSDKTNRIAEKDGNKGRRPLSQDNTHPGQHDCGGTRKQAGSLPIPRMLLLRSLTKKEELGTRSPGKHGSTQPVEAVCVTRGKAAKKFSCVEQGKRERQEAFRTQMNKIGEVEEEARSVGEGKSEKPEDSGEQESVKGGPPTGASSIADGRRNLSEARHRELAKGNAMEWSCHARRVEPNVTEEKDLFRKEVQDNAGGRAESDVTAKEEGFLLDGTQSTEETAERPGANKPVEKEHGRVEGDKRLCSEDMTEEGMQPVAEAKPGKIAQAASQGSTHTCSVTKPPAEKRGKPTPSVGTANGSLSSLSEGAPGAEGRWWSASEQLAFVRRHDTSSVPVGEFYFLVHAGWIERWRLFVCCG